MFKTGGLLHNLWCCISYDKSELNTKNTNYIKIAHFIIRTGEIKLKTATHCHISLINLLIVLAHIVLLTIWEIQIPINMQKVNVKSNMKFYIAS